MDLSKRTNGRLFKVFAIAVSTVIAAIVCQVVLIVFIAMMYLFTLPNVVKMLLVITGFSLSLLFAVFSFRAIYKYVKRNTVAG
jgi:hypothetical protein